MTARDWSAREQRDVAAELPHTRRGAGDNPVVAVIPWRRRHAYLLWIVAWTAAVVLLRLLFHASLPLTTVAFFAWYAGLVLILLAFARRDRSARGRGPVLPLPLASVAAVIPWYRRQAGTLLVALWCLSGLSWAALPTMPVSLRVGLFVAWYGGGLCLVLVHTVRAHIAALPPAPAPVALPPPAPSAPVAPPPPPALTYDALLERLDAAERWAMVETAVRHGALRYPIVVRLSDDEMRALRYIKDAQGRYLLDYGLSGLPNARLGPPYTQHTTVFGYPLRKTAEGWGIVVATAARAGQEENTP